MLVHYVSLTGFLGLMIFKYIYKLAKNIQTKKVVRTTLDSSVLAGYKHSGMDTNRVLKCDITKIKSFEIIRFTE